MSTLIPPAERRDVALQRGARAERDERQAVLGGDPHDRRRLVDGPRPDHEVGPRLGMERLVVSVLGEHVGAGADAIGAESIGQRLAAGGEAGGRRAGDRGHFDNRHARQIDRSPRCASRGLAAVDAKMGRCTRAQRMISNGGVLEWSWAWWWPRV